VAAFGVPSNTVDSTSITKSRETPMPASKTTDAELSTVASFPTHYFLENLVVRGDNSILVTAFDHNELWYVPAPTSGVPVEPRLMHTFDPPALSLVEVEPDLFYVCTCNYFTTHESFLQRLDLRRWTPGMPVYPEVVLEFPEPRRGLNGSCLVAPAVMLVADSFAGLIWRVDLPSAGGRFATRVWMKHSSMSDEPETPRPALPGVKQPGVNGVRFSPRTNHLYFTSTIRKLFMRVPVDPNSHDPAGEPEVVASGHMADDFCIDGDAGVAYLTTHRENTIVRVSLRPGDDGGSNRVLVGDPFTDLLIGPSSMAWGRAPGDHGRIAYVTTDGGRTSPPPDGIVRPARLMRLEIPTAAG
jgi:hypothetical protein